MNFPSWIVFAIVFFIFKVLTGGNKSANQHRGQRTFDGGGTEPTPVGRTNRPQSRSLKDELREAFKEIEQSFEPHSNNSRERKTQEESEKKQSITKDQSNEEIVRNREQLRQKTTRQPLANRSADASRPVASKSGSTEGLAFNFNSDSVLNGVIMSEVLGKPKSRQIPKRLY